MWGLRAERPRRDDLVKALTSQKGNLDLVRSQSPGVQGHAKPSAYPRAAPQVQVLAICYLNC